MNTTTIPAEAPAKVHQAVRVIRSAAYESEGRAPLVITVEQDPNLYGGLWFIVAERYAGTLAHSTLQVAVSAKGRGRLLTTRQWSVLGKVREARGWVGLRHLAVLV